MKNFFANVVISLLKIVSLLPLGVIQRLGGWFGRMLLVVNASSIKTTQINIQTCFPHLSPLEQKNLVEESTINLGKTLAEMSLAWLWPVDKIQRLFVEVEGEALLTKAIADKKGII